MAINAIQAAIRSMTGTERQFSGDLHAYWDQLGIPPGQFAERMVAWKALPQNAAWIAATEDADAPEVVAGLWRNGEQGAWYEAGDLATMFQDAAGALPVYAPGQGQVDPPVGRIRDKSGRGNHAYQTTTTSRPTLSARYNQLTGTESLATQSVTVAATAYTLTTAGPGSVTLSGAASGTYTAGSRMVTCTAGALTLTVLGSVTQADLRPANDGVGLPPYQRVVDPNTYDTVGFPLYLKFDGVDDGLRTSDIDFSGVTALFVAAAARKLSDAARGTLCELSSSYSNPGSFALEAPGSTLNSFMFAHTGATTYKTLYRQLPAPVSAVVVGVSDLPSGYVRLSAKSPGYAQMSDATTNVGGGSYATASLFIGRRAGSSQPFNGRLYSLYIRGGSSTVAQLSAVERHMNQQARIY